MEGSYYEVSPDSTNSQQLNPPIGFLPVEVRMSCDSSGITVNVLRVVYRNSWINMYTIYYDNSE